MNKYTLNKYTRFLLTLTLLFSVLQIAQAKDEIKNEKQKAGYSIGVSMGNNLKPFVSDLDFDAFISGLRDQFKGNKLKMSNEEIQASLQKLQQNMASRKMAEQKKMADKNAKLGTEFLTTNKKKTGVKTTKSGLQYKVIKSGTGATPKTTDTVTTHYRGTLIDGSEFDSSYSRGKPASFPVNGVIKGWTEALQLMKVGDKWELYIPSELAYGANGPSPKIGPNATLIFEIELLSIDS
jgi:FKBP-type peptidyl-prolyl cis-trans isomerase FklB